MELYDVMLKRRSIRSYTDEPVPEETLKKILEAGLLVPSSKAAYPMEMIVVRDRETIRKMIDAREHGSQMMSEATCVIVVVGDPEKTDAWIEDCALAMGFMQLRATELGVGSCWVHGRNRTSNVVRNGERLSTEVFLRELLGIPDRYLVDAMLAMGMPAQERPPHDPEKLDRSKFHDEQF